MPKPWTKIDLIITGAETELDRTVIDEIGDPLVHFFAKLGRPWRRTCCRPYRAGKPETGTVHLRAFHSGNNVFIEIEDDGRGIYRDKILKNALAKAL